MQKPYDSKRTSQEENHDSKLRVAVWKRKASRTLVPAAIKDAFTEIVKSAKECSASLQKCVNKMMTELEARVGKKTR